MTIERYEHDDLEPAHEGYQPESQDEVNTDNGKFGYTPTGSGDNQTSNPMPPEED